MTENMQMEQLFKHEYNSIYMIKNIVNNKVYIGRSVEPKIRLRTHLLDLRNGRGYKKMQSDFDRYGESAFETEILETHLIKDSNPLDRENHYIKKYNSIDKGYNTSINKKCDLKQVSAGVRSEIYYKVKEISKSQNLTMSKWIAEVLERELREIERQSIGH
jgi:group I intron endonuclease